MSQDQTDMQYINPSGSYVPPAMIQDELRESTQQLIKVLTEHEKFLDILRRELRGEQLYQDDNGDRFWMQIDKPIFVKMDENNKPIKTIVTLPNGKKHSQYIANDEAINEILSVLKMCGLNPIAPLTNIDENEIRADLMEMESKIAVLLTNKRKKWGIDKAEYPTYVGKIKIMIKDARYRSKDGTVLKALRSITSRIEQASDPNRYTAKVRSPFS